MSLYADNGLQALEVLNELHRIFDVARLVDPENNHVLTLDGAGRLTETDECCYHFWGRGDCCENCTSRHALIMVTDIAEWLAVWLGTGPVEWHTLRTAVKFAELTFTPLVCPLCV